MATIRQVKQLENVIFKGTSAEKHESLIKLLKLMLEDKRTRHYLSEMTRFAMQRKFGIKLMDNPNLERDLKKALKEYDDSDDEDDSETEIDSARSRSRSKPRSRSRSRSKPRTSGFGSRRRKSRAVGRKKRSKTSKKSKSKKRTSRR